MSNETWDLTALYPSIDSELFQKEEATVSHILRQMGFWCKGALGSTDDAVGKIESYLSIMHQLKSTFFCLKSYCMLRQSTDSADEQAAKAIHRLEEMEAGFAPVETAFCHWLLDVPQLEELAKDSPLIQDHLYYLTLLKQQASHQLSSAEEVLLSKLRPTGSLAFMKLWETASSDLIGQYRGQEKPISTLRAMAYDEDPAVRKDAFDAEQAALATISLPASAAMNGIKGEVLTVSRLRGYDSVLAMTLEQSRLEKDVLDAMMTAIDGAQETFRAYFRAKGRLLGHDDGLPFYDLFAPVTAVNRTYTYEEAKSYVIRQFATFSQELSDYAAHAFENHWIDPFPKQGKRGGAFCENLQPIGESRILANFTGSFNDVLTLAHELGHGYHGFCLNGISFLNSDYPMPIAETASTFCEILTKQAALKEAAPEEALQILESDVSDLAQILVDIPSRYRFEDAVFAERKNGPLSSRRLNALMEEAQKATYGNGLSCYHPQMWIIKPHYYDVDFNYYNFPYAYGLLFAEGLYHRYQSQPAGFAEKYHAMLASTGKGDLAYVASLMDIDIRDASFWKDAVESCLVRVRDLTKRLEERAKNSKTAPLQQCLRSKKHIFIDGKNHIV